jgi:hypothetical protein
MFRYQTTLWRAKFFRFCPFVGERARSLVMAARASFAPVSLDAPPVDDGNDARPFVVTRAARIRFSLSSVA